MLHLVDKKLPCTKCANPGDLVVYTDCLLVARTRLPLTWRLNKKRQWIRIDWSNDSISQYLPIIQFAQNVLYANRLIH